MSSYKVNYVRQTILKKYQPESCIILHKLDAQTLSRDLQ